MAEEIGPQTANVEPEVAAATTALIQEESKELSVKLTGETADTSTATEQKEESANTENTGAAPAEEPKVKLSELTAQRKKRQDAERLAAEKAAEAAYYKGLAEGRQTEKSTNEIKEDQPPVAPVLDKFDTYEEFEKAEKKHTQDMINYGIRKALERQQSEVSQVQSVKQIEKSFNERCLAVEKEIPDLKETLAEYKSNFAPQFVDAIRESDMGPQLVYYLAKNPQESKRLEQMTIGNALLEIGSMKEKVRQSLQPKIKTVTQAPPPIVPGNGTGVTTDGDIADLETDQYFKKRDEQRFVKVNGRLVRR